MSITILTDTQRSQFRLTKYLNWVRNLKQRRTVYRKIG